MASDEQIGHGYGDFIALLPDDDEERSGFSRSERTQDRFVSGKDEREVSESYTVTTGEDEREVSESYTLTTKRCVRHVTRRDYPIGIKRRRINEPEPETDGEDPEPEPVYGYYGYCGEEEEEEEEEDLWGRCPFVEESLKTERFTKRELSETGLRVVKERLSSLPDNVVDLESRWRKFHKMEAELELFRAELIRAQAQLVLKALELEDD